jgi:hypothetical protein
MVLLVINKLSELTEPKYHKTIFDQLIIFPTIMVYKRKCMNRITIYNIICNCLISNTSSKISNCITFNNMMITINNSIPLNTHHMRLKPHSEYSDSP